MTKKISRRVEHHHISDRVGITKCIDIYLDHGRREVRIFDALDKSNKITISAKDWNQLVDRIKSDKIRKVRR